MTAMLDAIASTSSKAVVATLEDKTRSPEALAIKCIEDEGPETFWKAAFGSVLAKLKNTFVPNLPEQFVNIPGDLIGAFLHWKSAAHQSLNQVLSKAGSIKKESLTLLDKFYDTCIKVPTDSILKFVGLDRKEQKLGFFRFGFANVIAFIFGTLALKGSEEDNMPGVNLDASDPKSVSFFKTIGYTLIEQFTHVASHWYRYYVDYKNEFDPNAAEKEKRGVYFSKDAFVKALANTINEKTFPGNFLSAIGACLSTLWLGGKIPKSAAAALGEIVPKAFTRFLEARLRRSTKDKYDETSPAKRTWNHRISDLKWFNKLLDVIDYPFVMLRRFTIDHIVVPLFKPPDTSAGTFRKKIYDSFNLPLERLKLKAKILPL